MANYAVELAGAISNFVNDESSDDVKVEQLRAAIHPDAWAKFIRLPLGTIGDAMADSEKSPATPESEGTEDDDSGEQHSGQ